MRNFLIGFILGSIIMASISAIAVNTGTIRSAEFVFNQVWDPDNNRLNLRGM